MNHSISDSYKDGFTKIAFCIICGCDDTVELLATDCPGKFIDKNVIAVDNLAELD